MWQRTRRRNGRRCALGRGRASAQAPPPAAGPGSASTRGTAPRASFLRPRSAVPACHAPGLTRERPERAVAKEKLLACAARLSYLHESEQTGNLTKAPPMSPSTHVPQSAIDLVVAVLVRLILSGLGDDVERARSLALSMLAEYRPRTISELHRAGEIIGL